MNTGINKLNNRDIKISVCQQKMCAGLLSQNFVIFAKRKRGRETLIYIIQAICLNTGSAEDSSLKSPITFPPHRKQQPVHTAVMGGTDSNRDKFSCRMSFFQ